MTQEIQIFYSLITINGVLIENTESSEINANYSANKIKKFVRSDLFGRFQVKEIFSLQIKEEAEIYGNL